jgi:hypothetical protein
MPAVAAQFDFINGWKDRPEHVYIHTLCLTAIALDPLFGVELNLLARCSPSAPWILLSTLDSCYAWVGSN